MTTTFDLMVQLTELADEYTYRVNELVGDDREDLIDGLAREYDARSLRLNNQLATSLTLSA